MDLFAPFVGDFITLLTRFLVETETWESKNKLFKALNITIDRSERHVSDIMFNRRICLLRHCYQVIPYARVILDPLPSLCRLKLCFVCSCDAFISSRASDFFKRGFRQFAQGLISRDDNTLNGGKCQSTHGSIFTLH